MDDGVSSGKCLEGVSFGCLICVVLFLFSFLFLVLSCLLHCFYCSSLVLSFVLNYGGKKKKKTSSSSS